MPPKAKFTGDEIIEAPLAILRQKDISAVTAREIGSCLGCSPRPIFTVFESMGLSLRKPDQPCVNLLVKTGGRNRNTGDKKNFVAEMRSCVLRSRKTLV